MNERVPIRQMQDATRGLYRFLERLHRLDPKTEVPASEAREFMKELTGINMYMGYNKTCIFMASGRCFINLSADDEREIEQKTT
jgi:hypothetical protein